MLRIPPEDFRWMTLAELNSASEQYYKHLEAQQRERWEIERFAVANLINIQVDNKDRQLPVDMFPFPWDKRTKPTKGKVKQTNAKAICRQAKALLADIGGSAGTEIQE